MNRSLGTKQRGKTQGWVCIRARDTMSEGATQASAGKGAIITTAYPRSNDIPVTVVGNITGLTPIGTTDRTTTGVTMTLTATKVIRLSATNPNVKPLTLGSPSTHAGSHAGAVLVTSV